MPSSVVTVPLEHYIATRSVAVFSGTHHRSGCGEHHCGEQRKMLSEKCLSPIHSTSDTARWYVQPATRVWRLSRLSRSYS